MKYIEGSSREQITFLPDCVEDYVPENSPVRIIDAFVEGLDISEFRHSMLNDIGRPPYNPRDLLKLYIYGYFNRIRVRPQADGRVREEHRAILSAKPFKARFPDDSGFSKR